MAPLKLTPAQLTPPFCLARLAEERQGRAFEEWSPDACADWIANVVGLPVLAAKLQRASLVRPWRSSGLSARSTSSCCSCLTHAHTHARA